MDASFPLPPPSTTTAASTRVAFPNVLARAELHSWYAWYRRHQLIFMLYVLWICGVASILSMWVFSAFCLLRSAVTLGTAPLPPLVQLFLVVIVLYESYHAVVYRDSKQGQWPWLRAFSRRSMVEYPYFRHTVCIFEEREDESLREPLKPMVPPNDKSLFAYHPHGVLSTGMSYNGVHSMRFGESDTRWLVAENLLWFPLLRDILHWLNFDDCSKHTFVDHLENDRNVGLIPGGFEEATLYARGKHRVFIKRRAGFIKLALQYGYKVHPVYTFGEEQTFHSFHYFLRFRMWLNTWKVPGVVFFGRPLCFFMPLEDVELTSVVGKPIQMPKLEHPTKEDVTKYHQIYVDALVALFNRHKHKYAVDPNVELELF